MKACPCGSTEFNEVTEGIPPPHYGKLVCASCSKFSGWLSKPDPDRKNRPAAHTDLVKKYGQGFCELCLLRIEELPVGEFFCGHHAWPYAKDGEPTRENTWIVCSACHALIEHQRTYRQHLKKIRPELTRQQAEEEIRGFISRGEIWKAQFAAAYYRKYFGQKYPGIIPAGKF